MTALYFFLILSLLILVHEGGHFLLAKKAGVRVEEFGFGIPPRIWGKKIGETIYSVNLFPFGGFVRLWEEESQVKKDQKRSFSAKDKKTRIKILLAGIAMNLFLGVLLFCLVYSFLGIPEETDQVRVVAVMPDSPADQAGLEENDIIALVNDQEVVSTENFIDILGQNKGEEVVFGLLREPNPCVNQEEEAFFCQEGRLVSRVLVREEGRQE